MWTWHLSCQCFASALQFAFRYSDRGAISKPNISHLTDKRAQAHCAFFLDDRTVVSVCLDDLPNWLWDSWCTDAPNRSKRHVHRRLQAKVTHSPQKLAHYQTVSHLGRNGMRGPFVGGHCFNMSACTSFACRLVGTSVCLVCHSRFLTISWPRLVRASSLQW